MSGAWNFLALQDDTNGLSLVGLLNSKDESPIALNEMIAQMDNTTGNSVRQLSSDNATELLGKRFHDWLCQNSITHDTSLAYAPESNGKSERVQRTILTTTMCLLDMINFLPDHKGLSEEAVMRATYLRNCMRTTSGNTSGKTPYEACT